MAQRYVVTTAAESDLLEIWRYIAEDNETAADRILREFAENFFLLAQQPSLGRDRPELLRSVRSFPMGRYVIFYRGTGHDIEIIRVLHSARDLALIEFHPPKSSN